MKNTIQHMQINAGQYATPLPGLYKRRRRKNKFPGGSFMGPGIRKKKTNKIHRSRMLKRKHKKSK